MATITTLPIKSTFIHIPKTGGNSVTEWLKANTTCSITKRKQHATVGDVINGNHSLGPIPKESLGLIWCIVRNPWDYCASWYSFRIMMCKYNIAQINANPNKMSKTKEKWNLDWQKQNLDNLQRGFLPWLKTTNKRKNCHHWAVDCDVVFKLENIQQDFKLIQEKMNCNLPLGHSNKTVDRKKYKDYYTTQESIDIVARQFKVDIDTYGYDF